MQAAALQDDHIPTSVRGCECNEQTKGERLKAAKCREVFPLSVANAQQLPRKRWRLLVRFTSSYIKPALQGEVDASATSRRRGCIGAALIYGNPSVNPPCGVLPAPRPGSLLDCATRLHSCPRLRGKWHEVPKGEWLKEAKCREVFPLSLFTIVHRQLPRKRWSLLGAILYAKIYELTPRLEQGRLTHCRS